MPAGADKIAGYVSPVGADGAGIQAHDYEDTGRVDTLGNPVIRPRIVDSATASRFAGGKSAKTAQATVAGDTTVHTPASGKKIRLFWASAINDPDQTASPRIILKFGATELYRAYAIAHWEIFDGAVDQPLVCNLDQTGDVAITIHYQEI